MGIWDFRGLDSGLRRNDGLGGMVWGGMDSGLRRNDGKGTE